MEATELRKKADNLEAVVQKLVDNLVSEIGACDIDIDVTMDRIEVSYGRVVQLPSSKVKVTITI